MRFDKILTHSRARFRLLVCPWTLALAACTGPTTTPNDARADSATDASASSTCGSNSDCGAGGVCTAGSCDSIIQVATGSDYTCLLRSSGHVVCWGGALGSPGNRDPQPTNAIRSSAGATLENIVEVAAGPTHACAREHSGRVWCWGDNSAGQSAPDGEQPGALTVHSSNGSDLQATTSTGTGYLALGANHSCVVMSDQSVQCWGSTELHVLGSGASTMSLRGAFPTAIPMITDALELSAGESHTCVRRPSGVYCWGGANDLGQLGNGTSTPSDGTPTQVLVASGSSLTGIVQITSGAHHTCARDATRVMCWGSNSHAQLGTFDDPTPSDYASYAWFATEVTGLAGTVTEVRAGSDFTILRTSEGLVWGFGHDDAGQLGDGASTEHHSSCPLIGPSTDSCVSAAAHASLLEVAVGLAAGSAHACALVGERTMWCWGNNIAHQLGTADGDTTIPGLVLGL